jgi:GT2 family glycosyltransferase
MTVPSAPDREVLIPTWNRAAALATTLDSIRGQSRTCAACVIDNGSSDGTAEMVESRYPEVRLLRLPANRGFGAAVNAGAHSSEAEWIVLLNNDVVADAGFVERLTPACEGRDAEMIAACMRQPDGRVDTLGVVLDQSLIPYELGHGQAYPDALAVAPVPLAPCGGAAAFRRAAFLDVGGFDERFFAYLEDADLGIRMRMAGMRCATAYEAFGWHEHAGTLGAGSSEKNRLIAEGRARLLRKYGANLGVGDRVRGALIDTAVYAGQGVVDRNLGGVRGRIAARKDRAPRPAARPDFSLVPVQRLGWVEALRLKLARRRN